MNPNPTSAASTKGRTERSDKPPVPTRNQTARVRSWLDKLGSFGSTILDKVPILSAFLRLRIVWVVTIFVIGFAAGTAWQSYGASGKSGAPSERLKTMSLALAAARKNLDKLANDMSRLEAQGLDGPQRRSAR